MALALCYLNACIPIISRRWFLFLYLRSQTMTRLLCSPRFAEGFFFLNLSCLMSNLSQACTYIHKSILLPLKQILSMNINWNICQAFYVSGSYLTIVLVQEAHFPLTFCFIFLVRDFNKDRKMGQYLPNVFLVVCFHSRGTFNTNRDSLTSDRQSWCLAQRNSRIISYAETMLLKFFCYGRLMVPIKPSISFYNISKGKRHD